MAGVAEAAVGILPHIFTGVKLTAEFIRDMQKELAGSGKHDLKISTPAVGDTVLFRYDTRRGWDMFYVTETINFPMKGQANNKIITSISVVDNWRDDTGGEAYILEGGVGQFSVTIELKSRFMRGYNFTIIISGKECTIN